MRTEDYRSILKSALTTLAEISLHREQIEVEITKLRQFISATLNMLPDEEKEEFSTTLEKLVEKAELGTTSLTEAIRKVLQDAGGHKLTVAQVRDRLVVSGFDFSGYTANPLASISTTLKRMKPTEVESSLVEGVTAYGWKQAPE